MNLRIPVPVAVALVGGAAIVTGALLLADFKLNIRYGANEITAEGRAVKLVDAETGSFAYTVRQTRESSAEAYRALTVAAAQAKARLLNVGFKPGDFNAAAAVVTPIYRRTDKGVPTSRIEAYDAAVTVRVGSDELELLRRYYRQPEALLATGVQISINAPTYRLRDFERFVPELTRAATADALAKARLMADGSAGKLAEVLSSRVVEVTAESAPDADRLPQIAVTVKVAASFAVR